MSSIRTTYAKTSDIDDIIRLQLRKPQTWKWELSTTKSTPHIPLPIIQLYDNKKKLLVETTAYERRSWHVFDSNNHKSSQLENICSPTNTRNHDISTSRKERIIPFPDDSKHNINTNYEKRIKEHDLRKSKSNVVFTKFNESTNTSIQFDDNNLNNNVHNTNHSCRSKRNKNVKQILIDANQNRYTLRTCNAGTLLINDNTEVIKNNVRKRRRKYKTDQMKNNCISSDSEKYMLPREPKTNLTKSKTTHGIIRRYTDLSLLSHVRKKYENKNCHSFNGTQSANQKPDCKIIDLKYGIVANETTLQNNDVSILDTTDSITMGANFSRHSSKGLSGRRCQSISNICNSKDHFFDPSGREVDAAYKFCNSLPSPNGTAYNNNYEHKQLTEKPNLQHTVSEHVLDSVNHANDCHPLQWKFTDTQTCDQGYGSERSPEEEMPPPIPNHDYECEHIIDICYSTYPFITPENTFEVELVKGSRGLGLSVCGGVDSDGSWPGLLRIKRLFPHQPAASSGVLSVGDLLLEVNGVSLTGLSNYEALEVLRMTPNKVLLYVCRPPVEILSTMSPISDIPPPPPRRALSPQHGSTSKISEDNYEEMGFEIILNKINGSLGFTLCKEEEGLVGHYVRALVREPAISDGRIQPGDKIIAVNSIEISTMSHEQAVQFLRQCDNEVLLRLHRNFDMTPVDLSPTDISPNSSFRPKLNLRQEAVDMLSDLAARKLCSTSPDSSPEHLHYEPRSLPLHFENQYCETDIGDDPDGDDDDKAVRPCFLDLYNPNQTPVAVRKSKFNLSLAHNAYELNNLDPEMLDAPNLNCNVYEGDVKDDNDYPDEPVSMPPLSSSRSGNFSHKKPAYQSAHPQIDFSTCTNSSCSKSNLNVPTTTTTTTTATSGCNTEGEGRTLMTNNENKWTGVIFSAERDLLENDAQILNIELNRGWNSRLGFSLQEVDGCTCVSAVYSDSVAAKDGRLKPGDCLLRVNDEMVENMKTSDVIDLLRIIRGPVCITVLRRKIRLD